MHANTVSRLIQSSRITLAFAGCQRSPSLPPQSPTVIQTMAISIRPIKDSDHAAAIEIAKGLPEWFDRRAISVAIPIDLGHHVGYVAEADGEVVGFGTYYVADGRATLGWLAA